MYQDDFKAAANAARGKVSFLDKNPVGYLMAAMLAGMYIGIGSILMCVVGTAMAGQPSQKLVCGVIFSVGLCCVIFAGAELFTGNNFVMAVGAMTKAISWGQAAKLWVVCYIGNLLGSLVTAGLFCITGINNGAVGEYFANITLTKMTGAPLNLFAKAILCNILVCLAVWCGTRLKSEGAKIAMIFACVGTFVTCGFEHSVANMTTMAIGMLCPHDAAVTFGGFLYNLGVVTAGNMLGAILFLAVPYYLISREK